jgi:DNA-binding response OmpR family regulator
MTTYDLSNIDILIAEDNSQMRSIFRAILTAFGAGDVRMCVNGEAAVESFRKKPADIVIADWEMRPMSGIELVVWLRDPMTCPVPTVPIIMITGHASAGAVAAARDAGVDAYLAKPVTVHDFYERIASVIENARAPRPPVAPQTVIMDGGELDFV